MNGPKTWSLAAALHPEVSAALDAAQDRASAQIVGWVAQHATTRVGPRGRQVQVPVDQIEAAVIRHYTSRAGDPHRHLHLQINARVWAEVRRANEQWLSKWEPTPYGTWHDLNSPAAFRAVHADEGG